MPALRRHYMPTLRSDATCDWHALLAWLRRQPGIGPQPAQLETCRCQQRLATVMHRSRAQCCQAVSDALQQAAEQQ